jgi:hypothetical protein
MRAETPPPAVVNYGMLSSPNITQPMSRPVIGHDKSKNGLNFCWRLRRQQKFVIVR